MSFDVLVETEDRQLALGAALARACMEPCVIYLQGDLGTGKTTLTRGFLRGLGYEGRVKSPTYTIMEPYRLEYWNCYHFDLYRLADPGELEFLGIRDLGDDRSILLIEWPEIGAGELPAPDVLIQLCHQDSRRLLTFTSESETGEKMLAALEASLDS